MPYAADVTRVNPLVVVRRERLLPASGEILVRRGQQVNPVQVIGRTTLPSRYAVVYGSRLLGVESHEMPAYLQVNEGDAVEQGTVLLARSRRLRRRTLVRSPIDGTVALIGSGRIVLQEPVVPFELRAMVDGEVTRVIPGQGITLETVGALVQALWDSGKDGSGKLRLMVDAPDGSLSADKIDPSQRGSVLVTGRIEGKSVLEAAESNGIRGIIAGSLTPDLVESAFRAGFPILVTDGIGAYPMAGPIFELLGQSAERMVTLFARNRHQPHNRPEIVIPLPASTHAEELKEPPELQEGQAVRVTRDPHAGLVGRVAQTYGLSRSTRIGTRIPGADVALPDGQVEFVPYTNLDRIT